MAMDKSGMAKAIIDEMANTKIEKPEDAMKAFSKALKTYIEDNCEIEFSWVATLPPPTPTPDPLTSYTGKITFPTFNLSNPKDMFTFGPLLTKAIFGGIILPGDTAPPTLVIPPAKLLPIPFITTQSNADNQKEAMEYLAEEIIKGMKKMVNPKPIPGTNPPYTVPAPGAIMTSIS